MQASKYKVGLIFFPAFDWAITPDHPEREEMCIRDSKTPALCLECSRYVLYHIKEDRNGLCATTNE